MVEIIEKRPGPLRIKFNPKRTLINLSEVDYQFIEKRHVSALMGSVPHKMAKEQQSISALIRNLTNVA